MTKTIEVVQEMVNNNEAIKIMVKGYAQTDSTTLAVEVVAELFEKQFETNFAHWLLTECLKTDVAVVAEEFVCEDHAAEHGYVWEDEAGVWLQG